MYSFTKGSTIVLALDAIEGDVATASALTAALRRVVAAGMAPGSPAATFTVASRAAAGSIPAGWDMTISAAVSATLEAGSYRADARMMIGGNVVYTNAVAIRIVEAVTP